MKNLCFALLAIFTLSNLYANDGVPNDINADDGVMTCNVSTSFILETDGETKRVKLSAKLRSVLSGKQYRLINKVDYFDAPGEKLYTAYVMNLTGLETVVGMNFESPMAYANQILLIKRIDSKKVDRILLKAFKSLPVCQL